MFIDEKFPFPWGLDVACESVEMKQVFNAWDRVLGAGALGWGGRWEEGSGWGTNVHPVVDPCQCMTKPTEMLWSN